MTQLSNLHKFLRAASLGAVLLGLGLAVVIYQKSVNPSPLWPETSGVPTAPTNSPFNMTSTGSNRLESDWKTYVGSNAYGEKYRFSIRYPAHWELGELRGAAALFREDCTIALGAGGRGSEGWTLLRRESIRAGTRIGHRSEYRHNDLKDWHLVITTFLPNYSFELAYRRKDLTCLEDYSAMLGTISLMYESE